MIRVEKEERVFIIYFYNWKRENSVFKRQVVKTNRKVRMETDLMKTLMIAYEILNKKMEFKQKFGFLNIMILYFELFVHKFYI